MTQRPLRSLQVRGFASIESLTLDLSSEITLLVGANGTGKSNVVGAFELLGRIVDRQLNEYLLRTGGFNRHLYRGKGQSPAAEMIEITAWGGWHNGLSNGYRAQVLPSADDRAIVSETTYFHDQQYDRPHSDALGISSESQLREQARRSARDRYVLDVLTGCRVFHFDDTSPDAPPKRQSDVADALSLHPDARNLASVLFAMRVDHSQSYARLVRAVQTVAPFFDDFELKEVNGHVLLRWREKGIDDVFSADALSDGTLRFICLAALLLQPTPPATIVLDEPELGLHPFAIHQLAALLRRAAEGHRIVAATQSVTLLEQFTVDDVAVVERSSRGTVVQRPEREALDEWLEDYSLGELWEKNVLGGRPQTGRMGE